MGVTQYDERLRKAYVAAVTAQQSCPLSRVQIHVGSAVADDLATVAEKLSTARTLSLSNTIWGFPVVIEPKMDPDHISIHAVRTI